LQETHYLKLKGCFRIYWYSEPLGLLLYSKLHIVRVSS
jgi:hypothetical protein